MKVKILFFISILFLLYSCGNENNKNNSNKQPDVKEKSLQKVSLRQEWFPNSNYSGAVYAKEIFAKQNNIELDIVAGSYNIDPVKMVISGENMFGDAGADRVIEAISKGADLVIIGVVNLNSPTCFISIKDKNIKTPYDFENHSVGILTGTNTEYVYKALINKLDINQAKIKEMEVPFDLGTFILDKYDVRPAFIYDEPVSLDLKGIKYNLIEPKNYGISFLGTVYFTRGEVIKNNPKLVQSFINSVADGWKASLKYPETAIKYLKQYDESIDENRELNSLIKGKDYFKGKDDKILWADYSDWEGMITILKELEKIQDVDLKSHLDNSFLENYYKQVKLRKQ